MTKAKNKKEEAAPLKIQGPLTIYEVVDVRERFLAHLKKTGELSLELEAVTDCDTAGIQLLYSALKTAKDRERPFDLKNVSVAVKEAAERAGVNLELFCKGQ
ncbi:MAG: STAS domain-containing protein [Desulfobacteraceae bacterium]|nr:MAG: STAS domain-containing protein [Desulfobacteraceae bacterium]